MISIATNKSISFNAFANTFIDIINLETEVQAIVIVITCV